MAKPPKQPDWIIAAALGWLIPGAGHLYLRKFKRGIILFVAISAMFYTGVAIGGTMTVDRHAEPYWFYAQMGCGIHGVAGWYRQDQVYDELRGMPEFQDVEITAANATADWQMAVDAKLAEKHIAISYPEDNIARVYSGVAGMLNILCAFDAAMLALMMLDSKRKRGIDAAEVAA